MYEIKLSESQTFEASSVYEKYEQINDSGDIVRYEKSLVIDAEQSTRDFDEYIALFKDERNISPITVYSEGKQVATYQGYSKVRQILSSVTTTGRTLCIILESALDNVDEK